MKWPQFLSWINTGDPIALGRFASSKGGRAVISIAHRETSSSTVDGTTFNTGTFTPTPGKLQVLDITASHGTTAETPTSVAGCGLTWVLVAERFHGMSGTIKRISRWRAMGPSPTNGALTITFATAMTSVVWSWNEVSGVSTLGTNGSHAFVQTVTNGAASGTTINATLAAFEHANNVHLCAVGTNSGVAVTPDADFAELGDDTEATPSLGLETEWARNQLTCDPTFTASISGVISSELRAA